MRVLPVTVAMVLVALMIMVGALVVMQGEIDGVHGRDTKLESQHAQLCTGVATLSSVTRAALDKMGC